MSRLRRVLARVVALWLVCHFGQLAAVPIVLGFEGGEALLECTCTHGDHAICPMHHKQVPGAAICLMGSADGDAAVAGAALGFVGVPALSPTLFRPTSQLLAPSQPPAVAASLLIPPDSPPPRA